MKIQKPQAKKVFVDTIIGQTPTHRYVFAVENKTATLILFEKKKFIKPL